jgi:hypothetical protein
VVRAHAALPDSSERQVWICQLQCKQFRKQAAVNSNSGTLFAVTFLYK